MATTLRREQGFTLIEALIVMLVIAILAMMVVPRLLGVGRLANEAQLRGDLYELRHAVEAFRADLGGHPDKLKDLVREKAPKRARSAGDGSRFRIVKADFRGPYLWTPDGKLPTDVMTGKSNWAYKKRTGWVRSKSTLLSTEGTMYRTW